MSLWLFELRRRCFRKSNLIHRKPNLRCGQLTTAEVYVNAERVLPCRDSARNPKSQQNGKDDLVAQRLQ